MTVLWRRKGLAGNKRQSSQHFLASPCVHVDHRAIISTEAPEDVWGEKPLE